MALSMENNMKNKKNLFIICCVIIVAVVAIFGVYYANISNDIKGGKDSDINYDLIIEKSDYKYQIAEKLQKAGIIKSNNAWMDWMDKNYPNFVFINGEYNNITGDMSYDEIAKKLENPDVSHKSMTVVIPEGFNVFDIAKRLEENNVCSQKDFLEACKSKDGYEYHFLKNFPDNDLIAYELEGFLFPATYDFAQNSNPRDVVNKMLDTFDSKISADMIAFCDDNDMTLYELITLASIVQEEALTPESAGNIASVFMNRLENNKDAKLQSDVTYFYAAKLRDENGFSQEVYDSYYTYRCKGLPSGPVANPGLEVINATVNHPDTDYIYFFSDLNNDFHFASDYATSEKQKVQFPWK